jgi:putative FmdB family regulatory protein
MPLYEFLCTDCGASTDVFASLAQREAGLDVTCAACGSDRTRRALSTVAIRGRASSSVLTGPTASPASSGGCCGGGCCG